MSVSLIDGHIDDDVMTDEQIIKALECCADYDNIDACDDCPCLKGKCISTTPYILDLINRQKAEIERLKHNIELLAICKKDLPEQTAKAIKAYAIKEFAERVKLQAYTECSITGYKYQVVQIEDIDSLVEEMVGDIACEQ